MLPACRLPTLADMAAHLLDPGAGTLMPPAGVPGAPPGLEPPPAAAAADAAEPLRAPHAWSAAAVAAALGADVAHGLTWQEAQQRLARAGPNALALTPPPSLARLLIRQFQSPLIVLLLVAAAVAAVIGDPSDSAVIVAVLLANAAIGAIQEDRAERALKAIRDLHPHQAHVLRDGAVRQIEAREVVPGDVVLIRSGDLVPADGRLIETVSLLVDESVLTGESLTVEKDATVALAQETALPDRVTMVYQGTAVVSGRAHYVVTATGAQTEAGQLASAVAGAAPPPTPLQRQMAWLTGRLTLLAVGACVAVFALGLLRHEPLGSMILVGISLAVAAVPEALPAIQTIVLALGVQRMARRKAIVRQLPAVEALGATTTICTDKTGTLTLGQMQVTTLLTGTRQLRVAELRPDHDLAAIRPFLIGAMLCNDARLEPDPVGDPTERALLALGRAFGLNETIVRSSWPRVWELPFTSERKLMITLHRPAAGTTGEPRWLIYLKGAPEQVVARCSHILVDGARRPLSSALREQIEASLQAMAAQGLRTLAVASRTIAAGTFAGTAGQSHSDGDQPDGAGNDQRERWLASPALPQRQDSRCRAGNDQRERWLASPELVEHGLTLLGVAGLSDPLRPEARAALAASRAAGIRTIMITGDHPATAAAIAAALGLRAAPVVTGPDLDRLDDATLGEVVRVTDVFARVSPRQKVRIVEALQRRGEVVAMTGDGANDAPALRLASIGVAMGIRGTAVAKEAAAIILADDNYATIVAAVQEGRTIFANLRKVVLYLLSGNLAEVLVVALAMLVGWPLPLQPIHILWINLVTDALPAIGLGMEPAEPQGMAQPPRRPTEPFLPRWTVPLIALPSLLLATGTLVAFRLSLAHLLNAAGDAAAPADLVAAQSTAFATLVIGHLGLGWAHRATKASSLRLSPRANPLLLWAVLGGAALTAALLATPAGQMLLHTQNLDATGCLAAILLAVLPLLGAELVKAARRRYER